MAALLKANHAASGTGSNNNNASKKTVDIQHANKLKELESHNETTDAIRQQLVELEAEIEALSAVPKSRLDDDALQKLLDLNDRHADLQDQLRKIGKEREVEYVLNAGNVLFRYYELLENGAKNGANTHVAKDNSILKYFSLKSAPGASASASSVGNSTGNSTGNSSKTTRDSRASLQEDYMSIVDPSYVRGSIIEEEASANVNNIVGIEEENAGVCQYCGSDERTVRLLEGFIECNKCFAMEDVLIDHDKPSYREPPKEVSYFAYKRMNHLNEHLSQSQGRESTNVDDHVIDLILLELKKQKITNMMDVTAGKIKEILKKLRIHKYYEHSAHILSRLTGKPVPHLSPELEEQLRIMFRMIQYPFLLHAPSSRKNFLSYSFVLHKCLQLLGHDEFLSSFPLLKSRDKLAAQDAIWRKICKDLDWEFVPSL